MRNHTRRRHDTGFTLLNLLFGMLIFSAVIVGTLVFVVVPMQDAAEADAQAERDKAIAVLLDGYNLDSIEVHYETTKSDRLISRDQDGRLANLLFKTKLRPVLTINGLRRPDCRIVGELSTNPTLECTNGAPNALDGDQ